MHEEIRPAGGMDITHASNTAQSLKTTIIEIHDFLSDTAKGFDMIWTSSDFDNEYSLISLECVQTIRDK